MSEERVESNAQTFATACDTERVICDDKESLCIAFQTNCHDCEHREDEATDDFEGRCDGNICKEERLDTIDTIVVVAIEDVSFDRVHGDIVEHYLQSVIVIMKVRMAKTHCQRSREAQSRR